jgi:vancomycin aglycone glucosyltransferase
MAESTVSTQFETLTSAAQECDVIVAATALQVAARSVTEKMGIHYVFAVYAPVVLPSPHHAPPPLPGEAPRTTNDNTELWAQNAARFNDLFGAAVNARRASLGLAEISDVRSHMMTDQPWLAADATLGPWPDLADSRVFQTGAWILPDERPLSRDLQTFLESGDQPIYFGFGSTRAFAEAGPVTLHAARALGRRSIVSQGWFDDSLVENEPDCLSIGEVNVHALFPQVAAVVHHGGAGTTTAAALAGVPQVVMPNHYDQHYWAQRVDTLGIGVAHAAGPPTRDSLASALAQSLRPEVVARARAVAAAVRRDGTRVAAERLLALA